MLLQRARFPSAVACSAHAAQGVGMWSLRRDTRVSGNLTAMARVGNHSVHSRGGTSARRGEDTPLSSKRRALARLPRRPARSAGAPGAADAADDGRPTGPSPAAHACEPRGPRGRARARRRRRRPTLAHGGERLGETGPPEGAADRLGKSARKRRPRGTAAVLARNSGDRLSRITPSGARCRRGREGPCRTGRGWPAAARARPAAGTRWTHR